MRIPRFLRSAQGSIGLLLLVVVVLVAVFGPGFAPHAIDTPIGVPGARSAPGAPLGTDVLGRDVLSRLLSGGRSVLVLGIASTVLSYAAGLPVGLIAGYRRSWFDAVSMRSMDVLLAFPALLILLLLVTSLGNHIPVLLLGVVLIQMPGISRVVRTVTQEVSVRGYVEAAQARGEKMPSILLREILPNIVPVILADLGIRFGYSILLIASVNYLGFGLQPPSADWGLSISLNQSILSLNIWAVLAPAIPLAALTIAVNLLGDAYAHSRSVGRAAGRRARRIRSATRAGSVSSFVHRRTSPGKKAVHV